MSINNEMIPEEIDQFLTCARVGRLGVIIDKIPYIFPIGFVYLNGQIGFHTCSKALKISGLSECPNVCFEVDESISDGSMYKSVIIFGNAKILGNEDTMIPYLQALINKYRLSEDFESYMRKPGRKRDKEIKDVRIVLITPMKISSRKFIKFERQS